MRISSYKNLILCFGLLGQLHASYYYEKATKDDSERLAGFCFEQNLPMQAFYSYLQRDPNKWLYMAIELETESLAGIAAGKSDLTTSHVSLDTIRTTDKKAVTELLLRNVLFDLSKQGLVNYSFPVQELLRNGMRALRTDIASTLGNFNHDAIRYVLYPATRFASPDEETRAVLRKYCQMYYTFFAGEPFFYNAGFTKADLATIDKRVAGLEKTYARPGSAIVVASFKDIIIGISAITPLSNAPAEKDDAEYLTGIYDFLTKDQASVALSLSSCAYSTNTLIEEGFRNINLGKTLISQLTNFAKKEGYPGVAFLVAKDNWIEQAAIRNGFTLGQTQIKTYPTNMPDGSVQDKNHEFAYLYKLFEK